MFFARKVVFVEGETEKVVIPFLSEKLNMFDPDISIIECGSKHNLPLYVTIAKAFGIPYVVVHDEDPLPDPIPDDWSEDKIRSKRDTFGLNEKIAELVEEPLGKIVVMCPDFERASGVSRSQGDRKGKALAALDHFDKQSVEDIPAAVVELVRTSVDPLAVDDENTGPVVAAEAARAG
jgi:putative ATP-dependent endonuclease of OLD family